MNREDEKSERIGDTNALLLGTPLTDKRTALQRRFMVDRKYPVFEVWERFVIKATLEEVAGNVGKA